MKWPFKTLKQTSTWPLQGLTCQFAAAVLAAPATDQKKAASKMIERAVRMGARLAVEFGMPAPLFVEIAKAQIVREAGPEAQVALKEAFGEDVLAAIDGAEEAIESVQAQVAEIFGGDEVPEA